MQQKEKKQMAKKMAALVNAAAKKKAQTVLQLKAQKKLVADAVDQAKLKALEKQAANAAALAAAKKAKAASAADKAAGGTGTGTGVEKPKRTRTSKRGPMEFPLARPDPDAEVGVDGESFDIGDVSGFDDGAPVIGREKPAAKDE